MITFSLRKTYILCVFWNFFFLRIPAKCCVNQRIHEHIVRNIHPSTVTLRWHFLLWNVSPLSLLTFGNIHRSAFMSARSISNKSCSSKSNKSNNSMHSIQFISLPLQKQCKMWTKTKYWPKKGRRKKIKSTRDEIGSAMKLETHLFTVFIYEIFVIFLSHINGFCKSMRWPPKRKWYR